MLSYIKQRVPLEYILVTSVTIGYVFTLLYFWLSLQGKQLIMEQFQKAINKNNLLLFLTMTKLSGRIQS